jgi:hypothetical protein
VVGKIFESAVHEVTSRDRGGEVHHEHTMIPGATGFEASSYSERDSTPCDAEPPAGPTRKPEDPKS